MSNIGSSESPRQLATLKLIIVGFSIVFIVVLANGYFNLFTSKGAIIAALIGITLSLIAWGLGKFIGSSETGIRGHLPLFILMLILSAVGVFNALMINLEGKRIFQDSIDSASAKYKELPLLAKNAMRDEVIESKIAKIKSLFQSLEQEIQNPRNCGEGPEAIRIIAEIRSEIPDFEKYSGRNRGCDDNEILVQMYKKQIDEKLYNQPYFVKSNYIELLKARDNIIKKEELAQIKLADLRNEINNGANVLTSTRPQLEELASEYQSLALDISKYAPGDVAAKVQPTLDMSSVRNLGEWSQIINLLLSRLDKPSTYVYLFLAIFADWILIYLFKLLRINSGNPINKKSRSPQTVNNPW